MMIRAFSFPAIALWLATAASSEAVVLFTEAFPNSSTTAGKNFSTVGWNAHVGAAAGDQTNTSSVGSTGTAVIWFTAAIGGTIGYGFGALGTNNALYWTTEPGPVAISSLQSLSFYSNSSTTDGMKFALRLDNNTPGNLADDFWVISTATYDSTTGGSSGNWATNAAQESLTFTTAGASWTGLNFTPGSTLAADAVRTSDLPAGNVTAFGLYAVNGTVRFDEFTINVVPEPSAPFMLSGALVALGLRRRRR